MGTAELLQVGQAIGFEHGHALLGRPRHHQHRFAVLFKGAAGGGAPQVVENGAALRQHGLGIVIFGEHAALGDIVPQALHLRLVGHQRQAESLRQQLLGQVVAGRAQAAGGDDDVCPGLGGLYALLHPLRVVPNHRVIEHVDADLGQQLGNVPSVGIGDVAQQQLSAHGDDLGIVGLIHGQD